MLSSIALSANAKINLHLQVGGVRNDGFHEIESIFQEISIADKLRVSLVKSAGCYVSCIGGSIPNENTLTKAYDLFVKKTGYNGGVEVELIKHIPSCAGLGGASTDAVALLKALCRLTRVSLKPFEVKQLALEVGSDCPFFLAGGTAFVSGRGEKVAKLKTKGFYGLVVFPDVASKTDKAYALLDKTKRAHKAFLGKKALLNFLNTDIASWGREEGFFNDFEPVVFEVAPKVASAKSFLLKNGASFAQMSGSGSSVFALFSSAKALEKALQLGKKEFSFCEPFITL